MRSNSFRFRMAGWLALLILGIFPGCGRNGGSSLENKDPGINDLNVIVAFGDSITQGSECNCVPYPPRLAGLTGGSLRLIHVADEVSVAFAMNAYAGVPGDWSERIRADSARVPPFGLEVRGRSRQRLGRRCRK